MLKLIDTNEIVLILELLQYTCKAYLKHHINFFSQRVCIYQCNFEWYCIGAEERTRLQVDCVSGQKGLFLLTQKTRHSDSKQV